MQLAFQTRRLRSICEDIDVASEALGHPSAKRLTQRISELRAAVSVDDLIVGNFSILDSAPPGLGKLSLTGKKEIRFCSNHVKPRVNADGTVDWSKVRRVRIVSIGVRP